MKNKKTCPKCSSSDLICIPGQVGALGAGNNIPAGSGITGITIFSAVKVTRYLCGQCGFSEEWIDDPKDIEKIREKYKNS